MTNQQNPFGLTALQNGYVQHRATDPTLSKTECAARAGYKGSRKTLSVQASDLERNPKVQAAMRDLRERLAERAQGKVLSPKGVWEALSKEAVEGTAATSRVKALEILSRAGIPGESDPGELSAEQLDREIDHQDRIFCLESPDWMEARVERIRSYLRDARQNGGAFERALARNANGDIPDSDCAVDAEEARGESDASMEREARGSGGAGEDFTDTGRHVAGDFAA